MPSTAASAVGSTGNGHGEVLTTTSSAIVAEVATGSHVLEIKGYSLTKGLGIGNFIRSSSFSVGGYRWCIRYYPDGVRSDNADWISIFLQLDHADDAAGVKARFKGVSVLNDAGEPVPSFSCTSPSKVDTYCGSKHRSWGFSKVAERKALEETACVKDDCLRIRCDITVPMDVRIEDSTHRFVVVPPSNMHQHFGRLLSTADRTADVTFEVAGEMIPAHRYVMAARSSVFMAELFGHMKEKAMESITISDMDPRVFRAMLHFIYTDAVPDIIDKDEEAFVMIQHLLVAADRYDLERLRLICEEKLCDSIDTDTMATTLALAEQHGCHGLKKACFKFLEWPSHLKTAMATEGFDHLISTCPCIVKELLAKAYPCP